MSLFDGPSRCSAASPVTFRWWGFPPQAEKDDIETAVDVLIDCIRNQEGRVWSPHALAMARAEFRQRIRKAANGRLRPIEQVKPVDTKNPPPLYEIRWQNIPITERDGSGGTSHGEAIVRMYHSEPDSAPGYFVGHHAHEKRLDVPDVNAEQQTQIKIAIAWHDHGRNNNWGIENPNN